MAPAASVVCKRRDARCVSLCLSACPNVCVCESAVRMPLRHSRCAWIIISLSYGLGIVRARRGRTRVHRDLLPGVCAVCMASPRGAAADRNLEINAQQHPCAMIWTQTSRSAAVACGQDDTARWFPDAANVSEMFCFVNCLLEQSQLKERVPTNVGHNFRSKQNSAELSVLVWKLNWMANKWNIPFWQTIQQKSVKSTHRRKGPIYWHLKMRHNYFIGSHWLFELTKRSAILYAIIAVLSSSLY